MICALEPIKGDFVCLYSKNTLFLEKCGNYDVKMP